MKKNVAGQIIGVQMVSSSDGSAFTSTVTLNITKDGGTQTASGGTGPTHEGNGFYTYAPTQAETNANHIGFTFTGTGAIPKTVQVYTSFPQTGDAYAEATSGVYGLSAIKGYVDDIGTAGAGLTAIPWNASWSTDVKSQVVAALNTDTYAEPGQGNPAATTTIAAKINYLYKAWRNKVTQTNSEYKLFNDDGTTVGQKAAVSDNGTTFERGEIGTGP
jgi:hypothetical protein